MTKEKIIKMLGQVIIFLLFAFLIINTDLKQILKEVGKVPFSIILFVISLQLLTQFLLILQWHRITKTILGHSHLVIMSYIFTKGTVIEAITPGAKIGGEATRLYYLKKSLNAKTDDAVSIILIQKSISMSVLMIICVLCLFDLSTHIGEFLTFPLQIGVASLFLGVVFIMIASLLFSEKVSILLSKFKSKPITKISSFVSSYSTSVSKIGRKEWFIQFLISLIVWTLFPVKMYILIKAFNIHINFEITTAVTMTSYMMGMLPVTPGGLGTFEGTMLAILGIFSERKSALVAVTVIFRFITFWFVIIASFIFSSIYDIFKKG